MYNKLEQFKSVNLSEVHLLCKLKRNKYEQCQLKNIVSKITYLDENIVNSYCYF